MAALLPNVKQMFHNSAAAAGQRTRLPQNTAHTQKTARPRKKGARTQKSAEKIKDRGGRTLSKREAGKYDDRATLQNAAFSARFARSEPPKPPFSVKIGANDRDDVHGRYRPRRKRRADRQKNPKPEKRANKNAALRATQIQTIYIK